MKLPYGDITISVEQPIYVRECRENAYNLGFWSKGVDLYLTLDALADVYYQKKQFEKSLHPLEGTFSFEDMNTEQESMSLTRKLRRGQGVQYHKRDFEKIMVPESLYNAIKNSENGWMHSQESLGECIQKCEEGNFFHLNNDLDWFYRREELCA